LEESTRRETREVLTRALAGLSERQRLIVTWFDVDGLTSTEIGERLELAPGTVRWHLHEARRTLRAALSGFIEDDG
jgi:RNA polymerase sigma factor (sigma-70 family)